MLIQRQNIAGRVSVILLVLIFCIFGYVNDAVIVNVCYDVIEVYVFL